MKKLFYFRMGFYAFIGIVSLLVLSFACYGQEVIISGSGSVAIILSKEQADSFEVVRKKPKINTAIKKQQSKIDTPQTDSNPPVTKVLSLEEKLLLYAQECWEDSSKYCAYTLCDWGCWDVPCECGTVNIIGQACLERYIHREPTFADFIKWLKKNK